MLQFRAIASLSIPSRHEEQFIVFLFSATFHLAEDYPERNEQRNEWSYRSPCLTCFFSRWTFPARSCFLDLQPLSCLTCAKSGVHCLSAWFCGATAGEGLLLPFPFFTSISCSPYSPDSGSPPVYKWLKCVVVFFVTSQNTWKGIKVLKKKMKHNANCSGNFHGNCFLFPSFQLFHILWTF